MPLELERLIKNARVRFPGRSEIVTLIAVSPGPFWDFVFEGPDGLGRETLPERDLAGITLMDSVEQLRFDGDPERFRLGIEARRIQTAFTWDMAAVAVSNIQPLPHQLEAVYGSFMAEPRLRFLLADDPGAGKTIMAGLYMKELELRRVGDRILVVAPASLRPQWARELSERFQLSFRQMDSAVFDANPLDNPWDLFDRVIVRRDFLRTERARDSLAAAEREWDLAVIDEAHGFTLRIGSDRYITNRSERYKAAEVVARRAHPLILMTATPHSGRDESLWGLLRLLDLDALGDRCPKKLDVPARLFSRTSKESMRDMSGNALFKARHPRTIDYDLTGDELSLYEAVTEFVAVKLAEIRGSGTRTTAGFALTTMQRRLASSPRAIRRTLERRVDRLDRALEDPRAFLAARRDFQATLVDDEEELEDLPEEERWRREEDALDAWLPDTVAELEAERELLGPLLTLAQTVESKRAERKLTEITGQVDMAAALGAQPIQLFALVGLTPFAYEIGMRVINRPRLATLAERDRASLLRQVRASEMVGQVRGREDQRAIVETEHRLLSRATGWRPVVGLFEIVSGRPSVAVHLVDVPQSQDFPYGEAADVLASSMGEEPTGRPPLAATA